MFEHILSQVSDRSELEVASPEEISSIRRQFPSLPEEYLTFLREVGWGNIGGMMIYSGPSEPDDIYPEITPASAKILIFGDDWAGTCYGFDLNHRCSLVKIYEDGMVEAVDGEFRKFISDFAN